MKQKQEVLTSRNSLIYNEILEIINYSFPNTENVAGIAPRRKFSVSFAVLFRLSLSHFKFGVSILLADFYIFLFILVRRIWWSIKTIWLSLSSLIIWISSKSIKCNTARTAWAHKLINYSPIQKNGEKLSDCFISQTILFRTF